MLFDNFKRSLSTFITKNLIQKSFTSSIKIEKISSNESKYDYLDQEKSYLLYIHIPFCDSLCPFCTFHKYKHSFEDSNKYFENLQKELEALKKQNVKIDSVYFGGGTPLINEVQLIKILKFIKNTFKVNDISCETDPNHIKVETITKLKGLVSRLSIGIQSFDDNILKNLNRYNKFGSSKEIIKRLEKIKGILPITNIDLIFNLPNQDEKSLRDDINIAKNLGIEQITTYPLMNSSLNKKFIAKYIENTNEQKFYKIIKEMLSDYSMNNMWSFSKEKVTLSDEYVSTHNDYIGLGSGAFSYLDGKLLINTFDLKEYETLVTKKGDALMSKSEFKDLDRIKYALLCGLFKGYLNIDEFNKIFDTDIKKVFSKELFFLEKLGILNISSNNITPNNFGKYLLVTMMSSFYSQIDKIRAMYKVTKV